MIDRLLKVLTSSEPPALDSSRDLKLAVAALLVEAARMDQLVWEEGETAAFSLSVEKEVVDLTRAAVRRYTAEDQRGEFPGDAAFDAVASLQNRTVRWGVADD